MSNKLKRTKEVMLWTQRYISGRTIDVGAGSAKYRDIIKPHTTKYAIFDISPGKYIDIVGNVLDMPFENEIYDTVISTQVLEHVEKPWIMVKEISRILKRGGICILTAPFFAPFHSDPHDYFRYSKEGMEALFKNEGFEIIECQPYGNIFMVLFEAVKQLYFSPYRKEKLGVWEERFLGYIEKICVFFDRFIRNGQIYANVYIVAKKKSL